MLTHLSAPPKPVTNIWRPELTRLPRLHWRRRLFRNFARLVARTLIRLLTQATILGLERFPSKKGPALVVINHLGDADAALLLAALPVAPDGLGKVELHDFPVLGKLMDWYGVIWLHRGQPDRRALRCALAALAEGRILAIAPEGRYSLVQGLEEGSAGAAFLALKANVPILPIAITGTQNERIYSSLRRLRRPQVTLNVGEPFRLMRIADRSDGMRAATRQIMQALARLLPAEYRGAYADPAIRPA
jgi:1-acyl-sn-glycerol-3-phosphate acyltransferase